MAGSLTEGVPDYRDPDVEIRNLLQSPNYRDRRRGKLLLEQRGHELARGQQKEEFYFRQSALEKQIGESVQNRADINRENEAGRMERARQHNDLVRVSQEDNRTRNLISAMNAASYDQSPEGKALLRSLQAEYAKTIGLPTGAPAAAAPAAGKGEFGPAGTSAPTGGVPAPTGGKGEYGPGGAQTTTAPASASTYTPPTAAFAIPAGGQATLDSHGTARADAYDTINPDGTTTTHFAQGGTSTMFKPNTQQGVDKINKARSEGAARGEYLDKHPTGLGLEYSGGNSPFVRSDIPSGIRSNNYIPATYTPPTEAFTQPAPANAAQPLGPPMPAGAPTPIPSAAPTPAKIQFGFGSGAPVDIAALNYTGGTSNAAQDAAQREEMRKRGVQPPPFRF
jgi:hypothetical protein